MGGPMARQVCFTALQYPISIAEMPGFSRDADRLLSQQALHALVDFVALHPSAGDPIPDSGGLRTLRWAASGSGIRGGVRVVYYFRDLNMPLYMLAIYGRGERADFSSVEREEMRRIVEELVEAHYQRRVATAASQLRPA